MAFRLLKIFTLLFVLIFFDSCQYSSDCDFTSVVYFDADSAYSYIEKQVNFGSRIPNSDAQEQCAFYLQNKLESFGANVIIQNANVTRFDGENLKMINIIGQYYPEKERRILLFAHWDSRYFADMAPEGEDKFIPVTGANDGASGVGVLLEIARQIEIKEPNVGIDIIFFDAEDQGQPLYLDIYDEKAWCLGSQFWCENPHVENYDALFGISLDMVGTKDAVFQRDDNSRYFNNSVVKKMWEIGQKLGHEEYFVENLSKPILHDHVFVSQLAGIRSIMIIDNENSKNIPYFDMWHTHNDDISGIDKNTLKAVGETVLTFLYCEK
ncbi:MAG: M28 family peptidase [Bacteroidales bacterium]|nr:M28 family peptidase [Bacteroidales bacterium]